MIASKLQRVCVPLRTAAFKPCSHTHSVRRSSPLSLTGQLSRENTHMIMPIGDDNTDRTTQPFVNYGLIIANLIVFVVFQGMGQNEKFTYKFATVPEEIVTGKDIV